MKIKSIWFDRARQAGMTYSTIVSITVLSIVSTLSEAFGIGMFLPIFQYMRFDGDLNALIQDSNIWEYVVELFVRAGIDMSLQALLAVAFMFFLSRQLFTYLRIIYYSSVMQRLMRNIRIRLFDNYIDAESEYHDKFPVGNLLNTMTTETSSAVFAIMGPLELVVYLIMSITYVVILSFLSLELTLASIVVFLLASRIPSGWVKKSADTGRKIVDANALMSTFLVGRLKSPRLVRLSGTILAEKKEFKMLTSSQRKHSVYSSILLARTEVIMEPIIIGLSLVFLYIAYSAIGMQVEVIGLYLIILMRLMPTVKATVIQWQKINRFIGSIEVVNSKINEMEHAREADVGRVSLEHLSSLEFKNVSYNYAGSDYDVLSDVSIKFRPGTINALVGPSGGGKSTLIDLIPRLREPTAGYILINDRMINDYSLVSLRRSVAYSPQNPQIFDGTIRDHICYGKDNATYDEIYEAARLAGADQFINRLPDNYDTEIGEDAVRLSGGQKQRLDLARSLIRQAPILMLDEPTSNLDAESEEQFNKALQRIREETNSIVIVIAHRLKTIANADQIIVLNHGIIEAVGKHSQIMEYECWYSNAWKIQNASSS